MRSYRCVTESGINEVLPSGEREKTYALAGSSMSSGVTWPRHRSRCSCRTSTVSESRVALLVDLVEQPRSDPLGFGRGAWTGRDRLTPRTRATVNQLIDRWLDVIDVEASTKQGYVRKIGKHIRPVLGAMQVGKADAEILESFYAQLRKCRDHCGGRKYVQHRTSNEHVCDEHDGPGTCVDPTTGRSRSTRSPAAAATGASRDAPVWRTGAALALAMVIMVEHDSHHA